jgi:hypothetical protein
MGDPLFLCILATNLLFAFVAADIGKRRGMAAGCFITGLLFGPFGILHALTGKGNRIDCPYCQEWVSPTARVCCHCQRDLASGIDDEHRARPQTPATPPVVGHPTR